VAIRDVVGRNYAELVGLPVSGHADPIAQSLSDGEARTMEARYEALPGVRQVTTSAVPDSRGRMRLIVVLKDVTELEEQRHRMQQALRLSELGRLAGGLAHEITPAPIAARREPVAPWRIHGCWPSGASATPALPARHRPEIFRCKKIINPCSTSAAPGAGGQGHRPERVARDGRPGSAAAAAEARERGVDRPRAA
jgi:hypothetical protein